MPRLASALLFAALLAGSASAQTLAPAEKPTSPEIASCKAAALHTISAREPEIKDIYIDEDGATIATAETKVEDTPITRIIMSEAYLRTDRSDKPRRFLCLIGEKGKVLLTFFTVK
jgi:hypothetical protein